MSDSTFAELMILFSTGFGLLLLGGTHLLFRHHAGWRLAAGLAVATLAAVSPMALGHDFPAILPAVVVGAVALGGAIVALPKVACVLRGGCSLVRRPAVRATTLILLGAGVTIAAAARIELEEDALTDRDTEWMMDVGSQPQLRPASGVTATTDRGRGVYLAVAAEDRPLDRRLTADRRILASENLTEHVIRVALPSDDCNCHGWVFTGGKYWVSQDDVERILKDNDYQPVSMPRPGDLVVYRSATQIAHTAVVRAAGDGQTVLVEGKWGWMGVFMHPVGKSTYGPNFTYYRTPRGGHILAGLAGSPDDWLDATDE
jgi:hypothetical protein